MSSNTRPCVTGNSMVEWSAVSIFLFPVISYSANASIQTGSRQYKLSSLHMHKLISEIFNRTFFLGFNTVLVGGHEEPFYKASRKREAAVICYRQDYASSALHEVAHWCIAGPERRQQDDYGYWYVPDGRSRQQQAEFEKVEVKPQALEWLFSIAAGIEFKISADNLSTDNSATQEFTFNIHKQANSYLFDGLPERARMFVDAMALSGLDAKLESESLRLESVRL